MQLDIFEHSRPVTLSNAVIAAFAKHDLIAAEAAIIVLSDEFPDEELLSVYDLLFDQLKDFSLGIDSKQVAVPVAQQLAACRQQLVELILPIAGKLLDQSRLHAWARPLWRQLALAATPLAFSMLDNDCHAALFWQAAGDIAEARTAIERIPGWRNIAEPLAWMCEIELKHGTPEIYWPLLAELAWLAPNRLENLLEQAPTAVDAWYQRFSSNFENHSDDPDLACDLACDLAWFPAWLLIMAPALGELLRPCQFATTRPAEACEQLRNLIQLEKTGPQAKLMTTRAKLRTLSPELFALYLRRR